MARSVRRTVYSPRLSERRRWTSASSPSSLPPSSAAPALSPGSSVLCPPFLLCAPLSVLQWQGPASLSGSAETKKRKKNAGEIIAGTCKFPHRHFCLVLVPLLSLRCLSKRQTMPPLNRASVSRAALTSGDKLKGRLQQSSTRRWCSHWLRVLTCQLDCIMFKTVSTISIKEFTRFFFYI